MIIGFEVKIAGKKGLIFVGDPAIDDGSPLTVRFPVIDMSDILRKQLTVYAAEKSKNLYGMDKKTGQIITLAEDLTVWAGVHKDPAIRLCGYYCEAENDKEEFDVDVMLDLDGPLKRCIYSCTLIALGHAMSILYD